MDNDYAVRVLSRGHSSYGGDCKVSKLALAARQFLENQGLTVTVKPRTGRMGDAPSSMVFINGGQVA